MEAYGNAQPPPGTVAYPTAPASANRSQWEVMQPAWNRNAPPATVPAAAMAMTRANVAFRQPPFLPTHSNGFPSEPPNLSAHSIHTGNSNRKRGSFKQNNYQAHKTGFAPGRGNRVPLGPTMQGIVVGKGRGQSVAFT